MASTTMVHVRVNEKIKKKAAETLAEMGMSVSDAVRMMLIRVAAERALPFEVRAPNATTVKAMRAAEQGQRQAVPVGPGALQGPGHMKCAILSVVLSSSATSS